MLESRGMEHPRYRDRFWTIHRHVLFAELLLNASQEWSEETEFELEGEGRLGGVGPMSTDVRLWLPGRTFFEDTFFVSP